MNRTRVLMDEENGVSLAVIPGTATTTDIHNYIVGLIADTVEINGNEITISMWRRLRIVTVDVIEPATFKAAFTAPD